MFCNPYDIEPVKIKTQPMSYYPNPWLKTETKTNDLTLPKKVIFDEVNGATVLYWEDGTKTVVRKCKENKHDRRTAFLTAYFQKHCGLSKTKANKYLANLEEGEAKE